MTFVEVASILVESLVGTHARPGSTRTEWYGGRLQIQNTRCWVPSYEESGTLGMGDDA